MTDRRSPFKTGFTLIELVIVIVIMSILYALVNRPREGNIIPNATLTSSRRQIQGDLNLMRDRALQTQVLRKVVFTPGTRIYTFYSQNPTTNQWVIEGTSLYLANTVQILSTSLFDNQVIFGVDGSPFEDPQSDTPASTNQAIAVTRNIIVRFSNGSLVTVNITPETGYVY